MNCDDERGAMYKLAYILSERRRKGEALLFDFFVLGLLFAPFAEFIELNLFSDEFFVLTGPVIYALTCSASKFYKSIL